jgi:hypothetical protein
MKFKEDIIEFPDPNRIRQEDFQAQVEPGTIMQFYRNGEPEKSLAKFIRYDNCQYAHRSTGGGCAIFKGKIRFEYINNGMVKSWCARHSKREWQTGEQRVTYIRCKIITTLDFLNLNEELFEI